MEYQNSNLNSIKTIFLTYALPLGLLFIAITILTFLLDIDKEKWVGYLTWVIMLTAAVYSIYDVRKKQNGHIKFSEGFKVAFFTLFLASVISSVYFFIHVEIINPDFMNSLVEIQRDEMLKRGMSEEVVEKALEASAPFSSPYVFIPIGLLSNAAISAIISAIIAAVMKKD